VYRLGFGCRSDWARAGSNSGKSSERDLTQEREAILKKWVNLEQGESAHHQHPKKRKRGYSKDQHRLIPELLGGEQTRLFQVHPFLRMASFLGEIRSELFPELLPARPVAATAEPNRYT